MNIAFPMLFALCVLGAGYYFYGRRVARWLGEDDSRPTPAMELADGVDYVPTKPVVLFGHHFASIAAAGPIVGPTLALGYGYLPTWLWILGGVVFIGAMHDMTSLFLAVREGGKSMAEVTRKTLGTPGYVLFLLFALILCILVSAAFLDITAFALTSKYPLSAFGLPESQTTLKTVVEDGVTYGIVGGVASTSVIVMTFASPFLGWLLTKKGLNTAAAVVLALTICIASVLVGLRWPMSIAPDIWIAIVAGYTIIAGFIPVWLVIQPRDFMNVQFLYLGIIAMVGGILMCGVNGVTVDAPAIALSSDAAKSLGSIWPVLFVTVACGSISGAHALVAGGTTCKQVAKERHILPIGYGGMLGEALLGICVTLVLLGGLGAAGYNELMWPVDEHGHMGKGNAALAFAAAVGGTLQKGMSIPMVYGTLFGILLLEGFLVTTVDTIVRLSRYLLEELWNVVFKGETPAVLKNRALNTTMPVVLVLYLTYGKGYKAIWPVFGTANQLLAALTLTTATVWLWSRGRKAHFTALPAAFMIVTTMASLWILVGKHFSASQWVLLLTDIVLAALATSVVVLAALHTRRLRSA